MDKGKWEMAWRRQHQTQLTAQHMPYTHARHRTCTSPHPLIKYDNSPQPPSRETFAPLSPLILTSFSSLLDSLFLLKTLGPSPLDAANSLCLSCTFELLILGQGQRRVPFTRIPPPPPPPPPPPFANCCQGLDIPPLGFVWVRFGNEEEDVSENVA